MHTHFGVGYRFAAERADGTVPEPEPAGGGLRARPARARAVAARRATAYPVGMSVSPAVRNVAIIAVLAAVVAILPGGGTGANVVLTGVYLAFLGAIVVGGRDHLPRAPRDRSTCCSDGRRALLYVALPRWRSR